MRITSFLILLYFSATALLIAFIVYSGLPSEPLTNGSTLPYIPMVICVINLIFSIYSVSKRKNANPPPLKQPTIARWLLIALGVFVLFCGFTLFSISLFSPFLFGSQYPVPEIGVILYLIISLILSAILYFASKLNTAKRPNMLRYIALGVAFFAVNLTLVHSLTLIYAVPVQPPTPFPFLSGIMTIAYLPFSLLVLIMRMNYVSAR